MLKDKKIVVVMPAYNAALTLEKTYREIPMDIVDEVILVDDKSSDETVSKAESLGIQHIIRHEDNKGYGGNQKTCYQKALELGADVVIMLHPDYQYTPKLIPAMASMMAFDEYDAVIGSRILGNSALKGGMPLYKYISNRFKHPFESETTSGVRNVLFERYNGLWSKKCSEAASSVADILLRCDYVRFSGDETGLAKLFHNT